MTSNHNKYTITERVSKAVTDVRFDPGQDTVVAIGTVLVFWPIYYVGANVDAIGALLLFLIGGNLVINVFVPAYYTLLVREDSLAELGIKRDGWIRALGISLLLVGLTAPGVLAVMDQYTLAELIPHVLSMGLALWEPLFVHGWLQIRYENAFGTVPGILLAGGSFGLYHLGTYPVAGVVALASFGCLYAIAFRAARWNLLALFPLTWAVGATAGTIGQFSYGWWDALTWLVLLLVSAAGLWWLARTATDSASLTS